jgi:uncharacterized protein YecE (DUF72 family)
VQYTRKIQSGEGRRVAPKVPGLAPASPVWVGTSGYSYPKWVAAGFYPEGAQRGIMLPLYSQQFSATELNHTWYQLPRAEVIERQRRKTPPGFLFAVKLTRTMTHEVDPERWRSEVSLFRGGIQPLLEAGQLAAVLVQLPHTFGWTPASRLYLASLLDALEGLPVAVELRHREWAQDRVFRELSRRRVSLVAVDEPRTHDLFPPLDVVTNPDLVYVRLHGRNEAGWRSGTMQQKFDYDYKDDELVEWIEQRIEPMLRRARRAFVFFNNHVRAQAPRNARRIVELLAERGLPVVG